MPLTCPSPHPAGRALRAARTLPPLAAAIAALALALTLLAAAASPADAASVRRVDLGADNLERLAPNCGRNFNRDCVAEGKATLFQSRSKGVAGRTFEVPWPGKLVAWSISLADVTRKVLTVGGDEKAAQQPFFDGVFGGPSTARIGVLRRVEKKAKGAPKYKLVRQTPVQILNPYFGTTVTFALEKPLNVVKGHIVALTVPTWAPALWKPRACNDIGPNEVLDPERCEGMLKKYSYRTSRVPRGEDKCMLRQDPDTKELNEPLAKTRPQTGIDSVRRYGCYYQPQVVLYSATIVGAE